MVLKKPFWNLPYKNGTENLKWKVKEFHKTTVGGSRVSQNYFQISGMKTVFQYCRFVDGFGKPHYLNV